MVANAPKGTGLGQEAVELAQSAGLELDEGQQRVLSAALIVRNGRWAAQEIGVCEPRQNGKGSIIEARELAGLFLIQERLIIHTAHNFDTSMEAFQRVRYLIEDTPDLDRQVQKYTASHGEEGLTLKNGSRLRFRTRTKGGGRGFTGDCLLLDEAMILPRTMIAALVPTLSARPHSQLWYLGSAVDREIHEHGQAWSAVRRRGHAGDPTLVWFEWAARKDLDLGEPGDVVKAYRLIDNDDAAYTANPAIAAGRMTWEAIKRDRRALDRRSYCVERLGIGDWYDDDNDDEPAFDYDAWLRMADPEAKRGTRLCYSIDVASNRSTATIGVAWRRTDGGVQTQLIEHREGTSWVVDRAKEIQRRWGGEYVLEGTGTSAFLLDDLSEHRVKTRVVTGRWFAEGCGLFDQHFSQRRIHHGSQEVLDDALRAARWHDRGEQAERVLSRKDPKVSPLVAAVNAVRGTASAPKTGGWVVGI